MSIIQVLRENKVKPEIIFDIGANVGSTVLQWSKAFPDARMFAFEPVSATYDTLAERVGHLPKVSLHRTALGNRSGEGRMRAVPGGLYNKLLADDQTSSEVEVVPVTTGDSFCAANDVDVIDFMKVDAEGHDLEVLKGFSGLLADRRIGCIQIETGVSIHNKLHVPIWDLSAFLQPLGYGLVGLGDISRRNPGFKSMSRGIFYCNVYFAAEEISDHERRLNQREERIRAREKRASAIADAAFQKA